MSGGSEVGELGYLPPRNLKAHVSYDGRAYVGWERQKNGLGVQEVFESAIEKITQERTSSNASGRTDAGVHALDQVVNFTLRHEMPVAELKRALNAVLPEDVALTCLEEVDLFFHARFSARRKTYRYTILNSRIRVPLDRHRYWMVHAPLDREAMREAASILTGRHEFAAFCRDPGQYDSCRRHLFALEVHERGDFIDIDATADGFLWNMVRILVGTLVHVGLGKLDANDIRRALKEGDRRRVGPTVPPDGLVLLQVVYDD